MHIIYFKSERKMNGKQILAQLWGISICCGRRCWRCLSWWHLRRKIHKRSIKFIWSFTPKTVQLKSMQQTARELGDRKVCPYVCATPLYFSTSWKKGWMRSLLFLYPNKACPISSIQHSGLVFSLPKLDREFTILVLMAPWFKNIWVYDSLELCFIHFRIKQ